MMNSDGIVNVIRELWDDKQSLIILALEIVPLIYLVLVESSFVLVQIHHERISQRAIEHLPRAFSKRR